MKANRINVVGSSGSGKSTFARTLAKLKHAPYIEMDQLYWKLGWQGATDAEFEQNLRAAITQDQWVLDGNYHRTHPIKWGRADTVVFLDLPFLQTLFQVTLRSIKRASSQQEIWPGTGNRESFARSFLSTDSVILWSITQHRNIRERYTYKNSFDKFPELNVVHLKSSKDVRSVLNEVNQLSRGR